MKIMPSGTVFATAAITTAVLALAGCGQNGSGSTAGATSSGSPASSAASPGTSAAASPAATGSGSTGSTASGTARCHTQNLSAVFGPPQGPAGGQRTVAVIFTNTGGTACYMYGYPGVDLAGKSLTWSLVRQNLTPAKITLSPGGKAQSTLRYLPWAAGDGPSFTPAQVLVTPPDETTHLTLAWGPGVALLLQDAATHPGTYIGPIEPVPAG